MNYFVENKLDNFNFRGFPMATFLRVVLEQAAIAAELIDKSMEK